MPHRANIRRSGFSLMEVLLATAILMGALAVLAELAGLGFRSARAARQHVTAQLLCETKMAEVIAGIQPPEEVAETPFEETPEWLYSITATPQDNPSLLAVQVSVRPDLPEERHPLEVRLTRWIFRPAPAAPMAAPGATSETPNAAPRPFVE